jgi:hypothetical protein
MCAHMCSCVCSEQLAILNAVGDFLDLIPALSPELGVPDVAAVDAATLNHYVNSRGHCSALVKVTGNFSELFMGHSRSAAAADAVAG